MSKLSYEDKIDIYNKKKNGISRKVLAREYKIKEANNLEFIGQIIDIFEDFLEKRGIHIHNVEQDKDVALIYGEDYFELEDSLKDMLKNWVVIV